MLETCARLACPLPSNKGMELLNLAMATVREIVFIVFLGQVYTVDGLRLKEENGM